MRLSNLNSKKVELTEEGFDNLKKEQNELIKEKRPQAVARLQKARSMGDLSENSEYTAAKENLAFIEGRIQEIEEILKNAIVIKKEKNNHQVSVGAQVTVDIDGRQEKYWIVGEFEADPLKKKLSHNSPIGQALVGKKVGDLVEIEIPAGKIKYKILEIK
ncbi:MAG: transcription elongation factor GreA [Microgenomates group bacterium]|nr:transcription elongation factor GreA [Microgenomates group bacterium]